MATTYQDIQAQIRDLTMAAEAARKAELDQALSQIRNLVQQYELTLDDLQGLFTKRRGRRPAAEKAVSASKGVPKYRDPDTGRTWTGQGKPPNWIKEAADRSVYLIEGGDSPVAKKAGGRGVAKRAAASKRGGRKKSTS